MKNKRIIYQEDDGTTAVIVPNSNCGLSLVEIAEKDVPIGKSYVIVNDTDLPQYRLFRNAWKITNGSIIVDLIKSKEIAHAVADLKIESDIEEIEKRKNIEFVKNSTIIDVDAELLKIKAKNITIKNNINNSNTVDDLYLALETIGIQRR